MTLIEALQQAEKQLRCEHDSENIAGHIWKCKECGYLWDSCRDDQLKEQRLASADTIAQAIVLLKGWIEVYTDETTR